MAGHLLDDELLALAGDSDVDERPRKLPITSSSSSSLPLYASSTAAAQDNGLDVDADADTVSSAAVRKRSAAAVASISKRRRLDLLDESDSDMDASGSDDDDVASKPPSKKQTTLRRGGRAAAHDHDDQDDDDDGERDDNRNPFPYQGLYKNARDYDELMSMNEVAREQVISERKNLLDERKRQLELRDLFRQQQAAAGATRKKNPDAARKRRTSSDLNVSESDDDDDDDAQGESDRDGSDYGAAAPAISGVASAAKSRKKKAVGATETKTAKLTELRKRRKEKASGAGVRRRDSDDDAAAATAAGGRRKGRRSYGSSSSDGSSSESTDDYDDEDTYGGSRKAAAAAARKGARAAGARDPRERQRGGDDDREDAGGKRDPPCLDDLNACRISRDLIEQKLYAPKWKEALKGAFIRFSWGQRQRADGSGMEEVYRIHQVLEVIEKPTRFYDLSMGASGKWCNVFLVFEHMGKEHEASLVSLSRSPFTESERERWISVISSQPRVKVPRVRALKDKAEQLEDFFSRTLTEADIGRILEIKKKVRAQVKEVGFVDGQVAKRTGSAGDADPRRGKREEGAGRYDEHTMAAMNDRHRKADRERIVEAERKAARAKREAFKLSSSASASSNLAAGGTGNSTPVPAGLPTTPGVEGGEETQPTAAAAGAPINGGPTSNSNGAMRAALTIEVDLGDF